MTPNDIIAALGPWRERVTRPAWRPVVEEGDGPTTASKFFGMPWTGPDAPWPVCSTCDLPMAPLLQLRLDDLPGIEGRDSPGLLQFFYCSDSCYSCEAEDAHLPFSDKATRVRILHPIPQGEPAPVPPGYVPPEVPAQRIVGWDRIDDRPGYHELRENGLTFDQDFATSTQRVRCPEVGLDVAIPDESDLVEAASKATPGDKLGGWPHWIQREEYPSCPRCGLQMAMIFQVASHDHARNALADFGTGHITQCPEHKDVVAFDSAR